MMIESILTETEYEPIKFRYNENMEI